MNITESIGKNLINVPEFAKRMKVSVPGAWYQINAGKIPVTLVGELKNVYVDWKLNKKHKFDDNKRHFKIKEIK